MAISNFKFPTFHHLKFIIQNLFYFSSLYRSLNSPSLTISRLQQISQSLNHNFFIYFIQNTGSTEEQLLKLSTENKELLNKVSSLQKEVTYLQEINALLKTRVQ